MRKWNSITFPKQLNVYHKSVAYAVSLSHWMLFIFNLQFISFTFSVHHACTFVLLLNFQYS